MEHTPSFKIHEPKFVKNSKRVTSVDVYPTGAESWILLGLFSGIISIWNYETMTEVKSLKISELPVRSAKFKRIEQSKVINHWIITAADHSIRVYDYTNMERIIEFRAHIDNITSMDVNPYMSYVVSASDDDRVLKLWNWEEGWFCTQTFEGINSRSVMQLGFNINNPSTFASASLDGTLQIWNLDVWTSIFTFDGQLKGVNCVEYFQSFFDENTKYLLTSGSDDYYVKVWDCASKECVQTLEGHKSKITPICASRVSLPIVITASEDSTVKIWLWRFQTFWLHQTFDLGLGKVWSIEITDSQYNLAFGCEEGFMVSWVREDDQTN